MRHQEGFPLTVPITLERFSHPGVDAYGDPTPGVYQPGEEILVFGYTTGGEEPTTGVTPERVRYDLTVYAPTDARINDQDRIRIGPDVYQVDGPPQCWDANPWWSPGLVQVTCNRMEG